MKVSSQLSHRSIPQPEVWVEGFTPDRMKFRFVHKGHRFTLYKRVGFVNWYVKFKHDGQQFPVSTGTANVQSARMKAVAEWDRVTSGRRDAEAVDARDRAPFALLSEILAAYEKGIGKRDAEGIRKSSVQTNVNGFRRLFGSLGDFATMRADSISALSAERFKLLYVEGDRPDPAALERAKNGANSVLRFAKAVLKPEAMGLYGNLKLSAEGILGFRGVKPFHVELAEVSPMEPAAVRQMVEAGLVLRESNPPLYVAHLLMRHAGLRPMEVKHARWEWLEVREDGGAWLAVVKRPYFDPKKSQGRVPLTKDVVEELLSFRMEGMDGLEFMVAAATETERWEMVYVAHSDFMRPFLPGDARHTSYELRGAAGERMALKYGEDAGDRFLRHSRGTVREKHYKRFNPAAWWGERARVRGEALSDVGISMREMSAG